MLTTKQKADNINFGNNPKSTGDLVREVCQELVGVEVDITSSPASTRDLIALGFVEGKDLELKVYFDIDDETLATSYVSQVNTSEYPMGAIYFPANLFDTPPVEIMLSILYFPSMTAANLAVFKLDAIVSSNITITKLILKQRA